MRQKGTNMNRNETKTMTPEELAHAYEERQKNRFCLDDIMRQTIHDLEGYDFDFRKEITDRNGKFSHKKACSFIDGLLGTWIEQLKLSAPQDPVEKKSLALGYIDKRHALYRSWLYIVMRCSLPKDGYKDIMGGYQFAHLTEKPTFQFLLDCTDVLVRSWCTVAWPEGTTTNEFLDGPGNLFGLHFYVPLKGLDSFGLAPRDYPMCVTEDGSVKPHMLKNAFDDVYLAFDSSFGQNAETDSEDAEEDEEDDTDIDLMDDEDAERITLGEARCRGFVQREEYLSACEEFLKSFQGADPEAIRTLYADMERIFSLYLLSENMSPMSDTDTALAAYSHIADRLWSRQRRKRRGERR